MQGPYKDLTEVGKLPKNLILNIADLVDEDIIIKGEIVGLKDILRDVDANIDRIEMALYNVILFKDNPKEFIKLVDETSTLTDNQKDVLKIAMKKIHDKIDIDKIRVNSQALHLATFGHMYAHIDDHSITTEFRPILDEKTRKIVKMIPSIVIDTSFQDPHKKYKPINFQMDLDDAQKFADLLNKNIDTLKAGIQEMRERFGSKVI